MINSLSFPRWFTLILLVSCFASGVFAQNKSHYSLLWKISGNGLAKPSYLFGTMHVKDSRVFNFSDSVMLCLQSCSRFALEVHPDTIISKMFAMLQNPDSLHTIDKLLDTEQYKQLAKKFMDKNGYPMGKTNPILLESLMKPDDSKPDDKVSFIDVYLYGIARTLNKKIFGLEDASSQIDAYFGAGDALKERLMDLVDDGAEAEKDSAKDEMIKIYSTGDIEAIYKYANESGLLDSVIAARNKVMAGSMIKYMANEPLFTAVGAAHLPGPDGIIALLKKAGYQVTQVKATFTGVAAKYHIDYLKMNWPEYRDDKLGYSLIFPGVPVRNKLYGRDNVIYPDVANDLYYGLYAVPKGTSDEPAKRKDVIDKAVSQLSKTRGNTILGRKDILYNKTPCTELLIKNSAGYMRLRMVFANNLLYSYYAGSKHNRLAQPYIDRFFNSFAYFPVAEKAAAPWITYTNTTGAFAIKFPGQPEVVVKEIPTKVHKKQVTFKLNMYVAADTVNSKTYLVRYNDYPPGTFLSDKDALFNSLVKDFESKGKIVAGPTKITKDGYDGRELKVILNGGYSATFRLYARSNRVYILLKEITQADLKDDKKDQFFESFQFLPYTEPDYYSYAPEGANFKIQTVSKPEVRADSTVEYANYLTNTFTCFSTNPNSGGLYDFEYSKISPYYRIENVDSLYKKMIASFTGYQDSLLKVDTVLIGGLKGREMLTLKKEQNSRQRMRILIDGENFFYLAVHTDSTGLFSKTANTFYNSFVIDHPSKNIDLASSKAEKICRDLQSADTLTFKKARGALSYYEFTKAELPYVYSVISRSYPDDTSYSGARRKLIKQLETIGNDSTINVLTALYQKPEENDDVRGHILHAISRVNKKKGYDTYLKLFTENPPLKVKEAYDVFSPLSDSVEYAAAHFDRVLPLIKYDSYRDNILRLATSITNQKDTALHKVVKNNYLALMAYAQVDIDKYTSQNDSDKTRFNSRMYNYMQLMARMKFSAFNDKLTKTYLEKDPKGLYVPEATVARINNNLPNNPIVVNNLLDSIASRYDIMEAYNSQKQLNMVPLKYRTQEAYAKLCLYQYVSSDDYGSPSKTTLLGSIVKNGSIYYVFKYLLTERDEENHLIGIAGPYKPGSSKLNFEKYNAYTGYDVVKTNWRLQAEKMIQPLLDAYK